MDRRTFLSHLSQGACATALGSSLFLGGCGQQTPKPNFVIILCDDLGYGDLGCYGNSVIQTPNLDRLTTEGLKLTDCYAAAPVCSPARAGMLTGRQPFRSGVYDWIPGGNPMHLPRTETTIARLLKSAGYATALCGKWHCNGKFNSSEQPQPNDHGFDHWFATQNNAAPSHENPKNFVRNGERVGPLNGYSSTLIVEEAIQWLRQRNPNQPFGLFVWLHSPHEPVATATEFVERYPAAKKPGEALYYGNVTQLDFEIGRLLQTLDELRLRDQTMVFFTSDNGPETLNRYQNAWRSHGSPGPLRGMKLHLYEGGIRVPGIIRWPGHTSAGTNCRELVSGVDLLPTICDIAGVQIPANRPIDGSSWLPIFNANSIERNTPLWWFYYNAIGKPKLVLRQGDWKILVHFSDEQTISPGGGFSAAAMQFIQAAAFGNCELYNLHQDLKESVDLAEREPERVKQMRQRLLNIFENARQEAPVWEF